MKLIKLEILNLASLDRTGGEVINFEEGALGKSTIFSIVGPMGSGKSTILDAICLALYNRAPRYPKKKGDRNQNVEVYGQPDPKEKNRLAPTDCRNILTDGKKYGYSKLTFLANNGSVYRAEWSVRFLQKCYENAVTTLVKITFANGKPKEEPADWHQLPDIIGLDYEQFLRTVLIAQGSFANFLNAKEDERYELLEKLVGCEEMYIHIATEIKAKKNEAVKAFEKMNASVEADNQFLDIDLDKLQEKIQLLEEAEAKLTDAIKKVKDELQWYADNETKTKAIDEQQAFLSKAKKEFDDIKAFIDQLDLHDAITPAIDFLRETKRLEKDIADLNGKIADNENKTKQLEEKKKSETENLEQLSKKASDAQKTIEEKAQHIKIARELKNKILSARQVLVEKLQTKTDAEKTRDAAEKAVTDNESQIKKAKEAVDKARQEVTETDTAIAQKTEVLHKAVNDIDNALKNKKKEIEAWNAEQLQDEKSLADKALNDIKHGIDVVARLDIARNETSKKTARKCLLEKRNKDIESELGKLDIEGLSNEVKTLRKTHTLMTSEQWAIHRTLLEEGKACPLCGATEHPYKHDETCFIEAKSELGTLLKEKEQALNEQQEKKTILSGEKSGNESELKVIDERLQQLKKESVDLESQWDDLHQQYPDFPKAKEVLETLLPVFETKQKKAEAALMNYNEVQKVIARLSEQKEKADKELSGHEQTSIEKLDKAKKALTATETNFEKVKALMPNLLQQLDEKRNSSSKASEDWQKEDKNLKDLSNQYKAELGNDDPDKLELSLNKAKQEADKEVETKKEEINNIDGELKEIRGTLTTQTEQRDIHNKEHDAKVDELGQWMDAYNQKKDRIKAIDMKDVEEMLTVSESWESIRQEKEKRNNAVVSAATLLENAQNMLEAHQKSKPEKTQEELLQELSVLQSSSHNEELLAAKTQKKNYDDALQRVGDKIEELARLTKVKDDWTAITNAIGSDGKTLRKIAQCYTLGFLIEHANAEICKFNNRYELLQVKNSLAIRVIDHDRADNVRDTTSLSGGETFIVSLGLALGLSALSSRNISFENLFIDEGFGTLDPDNLATVIDSLAMLQSKQGKKVGVISHTDTMSERITTQIRIIKNGNSGSSHIEIYP